MLVIDPSAFETRAALLAHIKEQCAAFTTWAHSALELVTEHAHAQPIGELVGALSHVDVKTDLAALHAPELAAVDEAPVTPRDPAMALGPTYDEPPRIVDWAPPKPADDEPSGA